MSLALACGASVGLRAVGDGWLLLHSNFVTKLSARINEIALVEEVLHSVVVLATLHVLELVLRRASDDD